MQHLEVRTDVHAAPETVFEFLQSFPLYANYSEYLEDVTTHGDGSPGTEYDLHLSWWRLGYTARSRVTGVDRPRRIDWELLGKLRARGAWVIEPLDAVAADAADPDGTRPAQDDGTDGDATRVRLLVAYDPDSADASVLDLPRLLSVDALVDRVVPLLREEATNVVERVVADLEGEPRPVELEVLDGDAVEWPDGDRGAVDPADADGETDDGPD